MLIVAVALMSPTDRNDLVLVQPRMVPQFEGDTVCALHWECPAGKMEPCDSSVAHAARRELVEETFLDADQLTVRWDLTQEYEKAHPKFPTPNRHFLKVFATGRLPSGTRAPAAQVHRPEMVSRLIHHDQRFESADPTSLIEIPTIDDDPAPTGLRFASITELMVPVFGYIPNQAHHHIRTMPGLQTALFVLARERGLS